MKRAWRRLNYANVAATLALLFAMSGGALAAKHYLITSTSQIEPKVLKKLRGRQGLTGKAGPIGLPGTPGAAGKDGASGKDGPPGSARAYAAVTAAGTRDLARSFNIEGTHLTSSAGRYCVALAPAAQTSSATTAPVASIDLHNSAGDSADTTGTAEVETEPLACSTGEIEVLTFRLTIVGGFLTAEAHNEPFTVIVS